MVELYSAVQGEGKAFVIIHGFLGMGDNWKTLGNKFAEDGYEVHLLDMRNHGRSPHTDEMNYEAMAGDVLGYCKSKGLDDIILLGHSMGGKVAMHVANADPDLIEKLIIVDISPKYYPPHHQKILEGLSALQEKSFTGRGDAENFLSEFIEDEGTRLFLLKNLYRKEKNVLSLRLNLESLIENIDEVGAPLPAGYRFDKDTLFIKGSRSNYITPEDKPLIDLHFPNARILEIPDAGHWVHAENLPDFIKGVQEFI
jgi:esterase